MAKINTFLDGVRVLDLSRHLPGPLATQFLADMGAEVTKIESPAGDELRHIGPEGRTGRSAYYDAVNAGKRVSRLDLRDDGDRAVFLDLVAESDVLVESFRPGTMARLGLDRETLTARSPGLITCALNGFGAKGPLAKLAAHDANYLALRGVLACNADSNGPRFYDPPLADCSAALTAVSAILGALFKRSRSGEGCEIDVALADAVMPLMTFHLGALSVTEEAPRAEGEVLNGGAAYYRVYETADARHVALCAIEPKFWRNFCETAGRADWIDRQDEPLPQDGLRRDIAAYFAARTLEEVERRFDGVDCCLTPVHDLAEAVESEQLRQRRLVRRDATGMLQALFPAWVDGAPPELRAPLRDAGGDPPESEGASRS